VPLLVLFDVDGTLVLTHDPLSGEALRDTLGEQYGVPLAADPADRIDHCGRTALRIAREVLRSTGLDDAAVDDRLPACASALPRTISSSLPAPIRSIAVRSPRTRDSLAGADAVRDDLDSAATTLLAWAG
jgi:hypothetical protein